MRKTVVCHFYNEEFLLPWWLRHHREIFDHGIMINYASTDSSIDIIRELCPTWEIKNTVNEYFDSEPIDDEVSKIEYNIPGWRTALNVTEFLYGNINHLDDINYPTQYFVGNYVFVDMEDADKGPTELDQTAPLHQQRYWGFKEPNHATGTRTSHGAMTRMARSVHNFPVTYTPGRHWSGAEISFDDLFIFYYGYASISKQGINRKTQIQNKIKETNTVHHANEDRFLLQYRLDLQPKSTDLREEINHILEHNKRITGSDW